MNASRYRDLLERHLEGRLAEEEARELVDALSADRALLDQAAGEASMATLLAGHFRDASPDLAPRVLAALRDEREKTQLVLRVMRRLSGARPSVETAPVPGLTIGFRPVRRWAMAAALLVAAAAGALGIHLAVRRAPSPPSAAIDAGTREGESRQGRLADGVRPVPQDAQFGNARLRASGDRAEDPLKTNPPGRAVSPPPVVIAPPVRGAPGEESDPDRLSAVVQGPPFATPRTNVERKTTIERDLDAPTAVPPVSRAVAPAGLPPALALVESATSGVQVARTGDDAAPIPLVPGYELKLRDEIRVRAKDSVSIRYADGTRMTVDGEAVLRLSTVTEPSGTGAPPDPAESGKRILLDKGRLSADVPPQPAGRPMLVVTPAADARVLGTRFSVLATSSATRLDVREGRVSLTRRADGATVDVSGGLYAVAAPGTPMTAKPLVPKAGILSAEATRAPDRVNLSREGTLDWMHCAYDETVRIVRRKGSLVPIGGLTVSNAALLSAGSGLPIRLSWNDGMPSAQGNQVAAGLLLGGANNGFQLRVPADTSTRLLKIYLSTSGATCRLEASLSDSSALPISDTFLCPGGPDMLPALWTVRFAALKDAQTMSVRVLHVPASSDPVRRDLHPGDAARKMDVPAPVHRDDPVLVLQAVTLGESAAEESPGDVRKEADR